MLGYWVRDMVSRKRRAVYLKYQPYLSPTTDRRSHLHFLFIQQTPGPHRAKKALGAMGG